MRDNILESKFQANLIEELEDLFPGCIVLKNDPNYIQGFPDLLVLFEHMWAVLECKASSRSSVRPNQEYYISLLDDMSFAAFISPDNKEEVLNGLQTAFRTKRPTRFSKR